jgi:SAM-dependent methyltransferase
MGQKTTTFLSTLYDFWSPYMDKDEYLFYHRLIVKQGGKALELFCGSGRLLLPFVKEGLGVSGIECSLELMTLLKQRALEVNLEVDVSLMKLDELEIKGEFDLIYSSLGSFQMISDRDDAVRLLSKLYTSLREDGVLSIALFLPWTGVNFATDHWVIASDLKDARTKQRYIRREKSHHDQVNQVITGKIRYETWLKKDLLEMVEKQLFLRWYSQFEFRSLLSEAGFKQIELIRSYSESAPAKEAFMLFLGKK